jgi:hypothetical protein
MKLRNFLIVATIAVFAACKSTYKATDTSVSVPAGTQTAFTTQYPTATNVVWTSYDSLFVIPIDWELAGWTDLDADDYLVRFDMDNENYYAWYDSGGNWIGSAYVLKDHTQLPAAVNTAITNKYAGYSIRSINREFQKDRIAYEIEMKKDDSKVKLLVDPDGTIIKEKMK